MSDQELRNEIKLALTAMANEAEAKSGDRDAFHMGISILWDHTEVNLPISAMISGWVLAKGFGTISKSFITEVKNEYLSELAK